MAVKSSPDPSGLTNPVKVTCPNCTTQSFVHPQQVRRAGGWECYACGRRH